jgi:2-polyprenyl-3-methyl-5-hydroxy-6-metoxy-1,4-benzoquinol methylase
MNKCIACGADASRHVFNENNYDWLRCMNCGLLYASGREKTINDKVAGEYDSIQEFSSSREKIFCRELKTIKKIINKGLLLDVGCGTGIFIKQARDEGYSVQGIEPDMNYYEYAVKRTGVPVIKGFLRDIKADNKYDIITYWDVLEHTPDPKNELVNVKKYLKDKGVLVLRVPSSGYALLKAFIMRNFLKTGKHKILDPPEHLFYFSKTAILRLLDDAGFKVIKIKPGRSMIPAGISARIIKGWLFYLSKLIYFISYGKINFVIDITIYAMKSKFVYGK